MWGELSDLIAVHGAGVETGTAGRLRPSEVHRLIPPEPERRTAPVVPPTGAVAMLRHLRPGAVWRWSVGGWSSTAALHSRMMLAPPSTDPQARVPPVEAARDGRWARTTGVPDRQERA